MRRDLPGGGGHARRGRAAQPLSPTTRRRSIPSGPEIVSLDDAAAEEEKDAAVVTDDIEIEDDGAADETFLEEEEEDSDDVSDLIDSDIEDDEET